MVTEPRQGKKQHRPTTTKKRSFYSDSDRSSPADEDSEDEDESEEDSEEGDSGDSSDSEEDSDEDVMKNVNSVLI